MEGNITKDLMLVKEMAYKEPTFMDKIINLLTDIIIEHLSFQIGSGADLVQIFDTHSNVLDYNSVEKYSIDPIRKICKTIKETSRNTYILFFKKHKLRL